LRDRPCESAARQRSRPDVDLKLLRQVHQPLLLYESVNRHLLVPLGHPGDGVLEVVDGVLLDQARLRIFQGNAITGSAGQAPDALQHGVEDRPGEVLLGVRQLRRVVRAGSPAQGQEPLALQVRDVQRPLPPGPVLNEVPGHLGDHR
jgi:hypothetical protein